MKHIGAPTPEWIIVRWILHEANFEFSQQPLRAAHYLSTFYHVDFM
jgi:hypothetical protein